MFVDIASIKIKGGDGGKGAVSFHRDKFTASGGPDGGNGGNGGNIVFQSDSNLSTLVDFRYKKKYHAPDGKNGESGRRTGKSGDDLIIKVPIGTIIKNSQSNKIIADLSGAEPLIIAKGGKGGAGNMNFSTPTRQSPRFAKPGYPGEELEITLELKLLADVGIVGYPNVGKSTFISSVSHAKPQIANYHFTTLSPVLGVVNYSDELSFVMADIPGLIEGAWQGIGLGHQFLRHVERCRLLLHIVDISGSEGRNPIDDFNIINNELFKYNKELSKRPMIVAGSKCDIANQKNIDDFKEYVENKGFKFFAISALTRQGIKPLLDYIAESLSTLPPTLIFVPDETYNEIENVKGFKAVNIQIINGVYKAQAPWLKRLIDSVNFYDYDSMQYFQNTIVKSGVMDALRQAGAREGDTVNICGTEFDFID